MTSQFLSAYKWLYIWGTESRKDYFKISDLVWCIWKLRQRVKQWISSSPLLYYRWLSSLVPMVSKSKNSYYLNIDYSYYVYDFSDHTWDPLYFTLRYFARVSALRVVFVRRPALCAFSIIIIIIYDTVQTSIGMHHACVSNIPAGSVCPIWPGDCWARRL